MRKISILVVMAGVAVSLFLPNSVDAGFCSEDPEIWCDSECALVNGRRTCFWINFVDRFCIEPAGGGGCIQGFNHCSCDELDL